jgi:hypothetical protein
MRTIRKDAVCRHCGKPIRLKIAGTPLCRGHNAAVHYRRPGTMLDAPVRL